MYDNSESVAPTYRRKFFGLFNLSQPDTVPSTPPQPCYPPPHTRMPAAPPKRYSFENLVRLFEREYLISLKPRSAKRYRVSIKALRRTFGPLYLDEISKPSILEFVGMRRKEGVTGATIRRDLTCFSSMIEQAKLWEWMDINLIREMDLKQVKESPPRTRYLSKDEERDLLFAANDYLRPMIIFAIETGFRLSEQMQLEWKQIDLEKSEVTLIKTKTDNPRVIPLTPRALEVIAGIRRHPTSSYVFCKVDGSPYQNLKKSFKNSARRAGIEDIRWHDLRRTCGCRLLQEHNFELSLVAKWLGHKSVTMTERAYAFLRVDDLHEAIRRPSFKGTGIGGGL